MIPITRKDLYLNKIVGNDDYDIPEKPITTEEFFFAAILGEAVQTPEPLSRYQIYLAKIAGRNISVPKPLTRLELFLAKACGMDIETPTPITREEIFWSNYTAIVEFEVEGVPPLTYKAIEGTLENYRIFGNTVGGESVGDRTGNLFDGEWEQGSFNEGLAIGTPFQNTKVPIDSPFYNKRVRTANICNIKENSVISFNDTKYSIYIMYYDADSCYTGNHSAWTTTSPYIINASNVGIAIKSKSENLITPDNVADINFMLNSGSTALPYEPYGYKVPIAVTNSGTTSNETIYLPEQIKKVGDEAEYIDYGEQKQHRIGADDIDVTLPALPTLSGTNTLSVGTEVQPSKVYVKGTKEREYT